MNKHERNAIRRHARKLGKAYRITEDNTLEVTNDKLQVKTEENGMNDGVKWQYVGNVDELLKDLLNGA